MKHTDQTDARIRKAYREGERLLDVAQEMGCTRNVIIGRARRLGLCKAGQSTEGVRHPKVRAAISDRLNEHYRSPEGDQHRAAVAAGMKRWWDSRSPEDKSAHIARMREGLQGTKTVHQNGAPVKELERT